MTYVINRSWKTCPHISTYLKCGLDIDMHIDKVFPGGSVVKNPPVNAGDTGDMGLMPGSVRSPGEGNGNTLQSSCLENLMDRGDWQATVHGVTKESGRIE